MTFTIIFAILAVFFFTIVIMQIRFLDIKFGIPGDLTSFCFLFVEGCIGTLCLLVYTAMGSGLFDFRTVHTAWVVLAGILTLLGLVVQNYSLSIGIAGITISIVNFSLAFQTVIG